MCRKQTSYYVWNGDCEENIVYVNEISNLKLFFHVCVYVHIFIRMYMQRERVVTITEIIISYLRNQDKLHKTSAS